MPSPQARVTVDLARVQANARAIMARTGVPLHAVIKADAYGLGAAAVVRALAPLVAGFYAFSPAEARAAGTPATGLDCIVMLAGDEAPESLAADRLRPAVFSLAAARRLAPASPVLSVDVGMERYGCPPDEAVAVLRAGLTRTVLAHGTTPEHLRRLLAVVAAGRSPVPVQTQIAATDLLGHQPAWLDATRPGLALYRDAVRVSAPLHEARVSSGEAGYGAFRATRHGLVLVGYAHGLWRGEVLVKGQRRRILEIGMQSAYLEVGDGDRAGDEVLFLGDELELAGVARAASAAGSVMGSHEALLRACGLGQRAFSPPA